MAAWIRVFCTKPPTGITAKSVRAMLGRADLLAAAEWFNEDITEEQVESVREFLAVEDVGRRKGYVFQVSYRPKEVRQVEYEIWKDPKLVAGEVEEAREEIEDLPDRARAAVRRKLARTVATVGIELGWTQVEVGDMGCVIAYEVAFHFARETNGLVFDLGDQWWTANKRGQKLIG